MDKVNVVSASFEGAYLEDEREDAVGLIFVSQDGKHLHIQIRPQQLEGLFQRIKGLRSELRARMLQGPDAEATAEDR